ncbi:MAG: hypothetical protein NVV73_05450 [Cellvibrionaceae bacterium]|nr:hypothetical protein [Cellvibrionaceae bacterium]
MADELHKGKSQVENQYRFFHAADASVNGPLLMESGLQTWS